jgi:hypothetical protein
LIAAEHTDLVQLKQLADGLGIAFSRCIKQTTARVHFLFFSMGSSSSFHARPFSMLALELIAPTVDQVVKPEKSGKYIRMKRNFGIICLRLAVSAQKQSKSSCSVPPGNPPLRV